MALVYGQVSMTSGSIEDFEFAEETSSRRHFDCHVTFGLQATRDATLKNKRYGRYCVPSISVLRRARICQQIDRPVIRGVSGAEQ